MNATLHDGFVRVAFSPAEWADYHLRWLRHNCDLDRHPTTGERTVDSSELPEVVRASAVWIASSIGDGGASGNRDEVAAAEQSLCVHWQHDNRKSRYALSWLRAHAYGFNEARTPPPTDVAAVSVAWDGQEATLAQIVAAALGTLASHGVAVVRRAPSAPTTSGNPDPLPPPDAQTEAIIHGFAAAGLALIGTHFGRIEDLRTDNTTNANTDQLGYTDAAIDVHTDQPFLDRPPRYQLLHGIRGADAGGENFLVDAAAAYQYLSAIDAPAARALVATPVTFHRRQKAFEKTLVSPLVTTGGPGGFQIRYSYFTMAPHQVPFNEMEAWYRAYDQFARVVRNPAHQYRLRLGPGDFLIYDNHRMLHGRTAFAGPRWVRGVYFDRATHV